MHADELRPIVAPPLASPTPSMQSNSAYGFGSGQTVNSAVDAYRLLLGQAEGSRSRGGNTAPTNQAVPTAASLNRNKHLIIRRAVRSPYTGETTWRTEVVKDPLVIKAYLRQRRIIEMHARRDTDPASLNKAESWGQVLSSYTQEQLNRLRKTQSRERDEKKKRSSKHMTTFSLPQPNKPKKDVIRRCGNCGQLGHMKTNKKCPRYYEFNPA
ncbi:hypothetical protein EV182_002600 [Spiromyces aspiralis]|uniref:Uncharacterized protein n=1 Tax=Spiromyces aspiralis TaxID=68401 RepID=A0ACC1HV98_9FUNG|nr:hypothetical protein EV182_002600 [Spiromyces aspiralis]